MFINFCGLAHFAIIVIDKEIQALHKIESN